VGLGRVHGRDTEREAIAALDREPGLLDQPVGLAPEVAAAGKARPHRDVCRSLEHPPRPSRRGDVLEEAQLRVRAQDTEELGEGRLNVGDRAEYERVDTWLQGRLAGATEKPDVHALALVLIEPMSAYHSMRRTFGRTPGDVDDERFSAAWVETALAVTRRVGLA
jgi:hypothetical protein